MAGFDNDVMYANNADFSTAGAGGGSESNGLVTNGKLWIGSTALNVGGTHINVGSLTSPDNTVTIGYSSPNITLQSGGVVPIVFTEDSGLATPAGGNLNVLGQKAGTTPVMFTIGSGSTIDIEDRTWTTSLVVDPSVTVGLRGTFQTITAALAAATSGQTIFIRRGTYTENLTLKAGVNLAAFDCDAENISVVVVGSCSATFTGSCSLSGIGFQTNGVASSVVITGANATVVHLTNCFCNTTSGTSFENSGSNASAVMNIFSCRGDISGGNGCVIYQNTSNGTINIYSSNFTNSSLGLSANNCLAGFVNIFSSSFQNGVANQTTGTTLISDSSIVTSAQNALCLSSNSNAGAVLTASNCYFDSGTASAIVCAGNSAIINATNCTLKTSNANAISRSAGTTPTIQYGNLSFIGSSATIDSTLIQVPFIHTNDAIKITTPGAYPYTTLPQDGVILVDSSSARTITPLASPTTGQRHFIKDNAGSAAANNITITPSGKNIDGVASFVIATNYGCAEIVYNGTQWNVI